MEYRILGLSGLRVSAVGLGCMGMSHAYGAPADKREMTELLADAVGMGYTFFDTAEVYGTPDRPHDNEELLGEVLRPYRDSIVLGTKFGLAFDVSNAAGPHALVPDARPATIRRSVEGSLRRLRTDRIDIYYQHRIDPSVEPETVAEVMAGLIREGKILHWGISEATEEYSAPCPPCLPCGGDTEPVFDDGALARGVAACLRGARHRFRGTFSARQRLADQLLHCRYGFRPCYRLSCVYAAVPPGEFREEPCVVFSS